MLVILECGVIIIFQVMEDQYLNDLLHISQFSSEWQLAFFFYKTRLTCSSVHQCRGCHEYGNNPLGSIKYGEFIDYTEAVESRLMDNWV